jgi:hypothetical protein
MPLVGLGFDALAFDELGDERVTTFVVAVAVDPLDEYSP